MAGMGYAVINILRCQIEACGDQADVLGLIADDEANNRPNTSDANMALNLIRQRAQATERSDLTLAATIMDAALAGYNSGYHYGQWKVEHDQANIIDLRRAAIRELREWCEAHPDASDDDVSEHIREIADRRTPIYTTSLMEVMMNHQGLAATDDDLEGSTCVEVARNVINADLCEAMDELWGIIVAERESEEIDENEEGEA